MLASLSLATSPRLLGAAAPNAASISGQSRSTQPQSQPQDQVCVSSPYAQGSPRPASPTALPAPPDLARSTDELSPQANLIAVGAALALAVAGVITAGVPTHLPTTQSQYSQSAALQGVSQASALEGTRTAQDALNTLKYLDGVGTQNGGGLFETQFGVLEKQVSPEAAFDALVSNHEVRYRDAKGETPHLIDTFDQLTQLKGRVQEQQLRNAVDQGINQVQHGVHQAGQAIGQAIH